ncbi:hypothetical protein RvY_18210 [Ramazzottius varieornatus]|uniref:Uncharacterized protein n=1 Tax=Ramazzottius varieornatus TaxID=947166 RepID=A0A1D1W4X1_RAMVA|nr:hypothetical protein RvY_18210 [Ramazzottius varieornatus]
MNVRQQQHQQRPAVNQPILIGQGQHRTQTSSEGSEWGGEEDENFLCNVEEEYMASQAASKQASPSNGAALPVLQKFGLARQPVRQMHPGPPPQVQVRPPHQGPRNNLSPQPRPQIRPSQPNARPPSQFQTPRPAFQPQSSQSLPRLAFPPSQAPRNVPYQPSISQLPQKKVPENLQEALQQIASMESTTLIQKGEVTNVRLEVKRKEEEVMKLKRELEACRRNAQQELNLLQQQHKLDQDRLQTELNFKNQELVEVAHRVCRLESDYKTDCPTTSNSCLPDIKTPQKRLAPPDRGNFPTPSAFYDTSDSPRIKRQRKEEQAAEREKMLVSREIQTDAEVSTGVAPQPEGFLGSRARSVSGQVSMAQVGQGEEGGAVVVEAVPAADGANKAVPRSTQDSTDTDRAAVRSYKIVHDLNDSRPSMEEMFTLAVLLQPPPQFEHSSSFELDLERKKQIDLQLSRSGKLPKKVVKEEIQAILTSSKAPKAALYPPHIVAQEAIALFVSAERRLSCANKNVANLILGLLVPVLADHLRQYASFLHNLSALANAGSLSKSTSCNGSQEGGGGGGQLGEVSSLTVYFSSLMANSSWSNLKFVEAVERNSKLTLIVLKKLLTFCPEVHKFVMKEIQANAVYSDLAAHFSEMRVFAADQADELEEKNGAQPREEEGWSETSAEEWLLVRQQLSSKYRLDGRVQQQAMLQLTKTPPALKSASAFQLLLLLCDPVQFKIYQKDMLALAAGAMTALADSVPVDSEEAHQIGDGLLSEEVLTNFVAAAASDELALQPAISLLSVLLKWSWCCPRLCTGDAETCPLLRLYLNVFSIPPLKQRHVIDQGLLHKQMLDCLFDICFATDPHKTALLAYPQRHCVISLMHLFVEVLHSYVWSLSSQAEFAQEDQVGLCLPSFQQIILEGVLFLYCMKNRQTSASTFQKMIHLVNHYLQEIIVLLHHQRLFSYSEEFQTCLEHMYDDVIHSKLSLAPLSAQPME